MEEKNIKKRKRGFFAMVTSIIIGTISLSASAEAYYLKVISYDEASGKARIQICAEDSDSKLANDPLILDNVAVSPNRENPPSCTQNGKVDYASGSIGSFKIITTQEAEEEIDIFDSGSIVVPPLGHEWDSGVITQNPTRYSTGVKKFTCKRCGETKTEEISYEEGPGRRPIEKPEYKPPVTEATTTETTSEPITLPPETTSAPDETTAPPVEEPIVPTEIDIPIDIINRVTDERFSMTIHFDYDGPLPFDDVLTVDLKASNAGYNANLYCYNPDVQDLEFLSTAKIDENGNAELHFRQDSAYTIIIDGDPVNPHTGTAVTGIAVLTISAAAAMYLAIRKHKK